MASELIKCIECGAMVPEHSVDREGLCTDCHAAESGGMCVGDTGEGR